MLPITVDQVRDAIGTTTKPAFAETNRKAFDLGYEAARQAA
jgi:hypothetical protein